MTQNIYQVTDEVHLDTILTKEHADTLVLIMYSAKTCKPCKEFKPRFVNIAKANKSIFFVYIDITNYSTLDNKYFRDCDKTPMFLYYFNNTRCATVVGVNEQAIVSIMGQLEQKIIARKKQLEQEIKPELPKYKSPDTELLEKKMVLYNKLVDLHNKGVKLTASYSINSDYEDLALEYRYQTDPEFRKEILEFQERERIKALQKPVEEKVNVEQMASEKPPEGVIENTPDIELAKKQQQAKEMSSVHKKMQLLSYQKLEQLKKIQQLKEQDERK
jgi:thiol-disulfide isomerase/thioredoxin